MVKIYSYSTTYTYPGYHTHARTAGAHYFADPLPFQSHIQPQPQPQPVFYTSSSSSSNEFMDSHRPHRHHRASFTASGSGSGSAGGGGGGGAFYDMNSRSGSISGDYHHQGMMLQAVNSSDSTVHTG